MLVCVGAGGGTKMKLCEYMGATGMQESQVASRFLPHAFWEAAREAICLH